MSKKASLDDLTPEQRQRLQQFAFVHGKTWKKTLNDMWWDGSDAYQHDGHLLRQIRNQHGPQWLEGVRL